MQTDNEKAPEGCRLDQVDDSRPEESLLEQIRQKEEELNKAIREAESESSGRILKASEDAELTMKQDREDADREGQEILQKVMLEVRTESEKLVAEGEITRKANQERKNRNFDSVVERIIKVVESG
jgi:vacuolar-type H+-ATPase subunit H